MTTEEKPTPTAPTADAPHEEHAAEHAPPSTRALRAMAVVRWILLALVTALAAHTMWTYWGPAHGGVHGAQREDLYYCPMHPQIRSPDPGECPICHMALELIPEERRHAPRDAAAGASHDHTHAAHPGEVGPVTLSEEQQRSVGLATSVAESASVGGRLRVPGVVTAPETGLAQVRVRAEGFVEEVLVRQTGVRVSKGQTLARIYSPEIYRAQEELIAATRWTSAEASATQSATANIAAAARRGLELLGLSSADIDAIEKSRQPMRAIPVRATASGYVTQFNAVLGSRADPERVLYEIADLSKVWIVASVHERDMSTVRAGTTAKLTLAGAPEATLTARVELVEPLVEEATRTARVRLVVDNREGALRPGQFGEVEFEHAATEGVFVPRDAVIRTGAHQYVYVASGPDRFEPRSVRTGLVREGRVQVLEGVLPGDRVVTRGSFMLDSESRLQTSLGAAPAAGTP